jgi:hypothetical protein
MLNQRETNGDAGGVADGTSFVVKLPRSFKGTKGC